MTHSYDHATATGKKLKILNELIAREKSFNESIPSVTTIGNNNKLTKSQALAKKESVDSFMGWFNNQFRKGGLTWSQRLTMQTAAQRIYQEQDISNKIIEIDSILSNPENIERWINEERQIKKKEYERLLQIELEEKRIQDEIDRKELERLQVLQDIENVKLAAIKKENIRLANIEAPKRAALQAARIEKIKQDDFKRLVEIELQKILNTEIKPTISPEIIPAVVTASSLIPLGIIAILLINSSRGKK